MKTYEDVIARVGRERHGMVRSDLLDVEGVPQHAVDWLRGRGRLVSLGRGVDRLRDHPFDYASRCQAALDLAGAGAVLGRRTAARLHGCYSYRRCDDIDVLVPRGRDHRTAIGRIVQTRWLPADHVTQLDGFAVTTLARTLFDLCGDPPPGMPVRHPAHERAMARVYNDALARRGLTFHQEAAVLTVLARRGRAGTALVRKLLLRFGPQYEPTQSDTESLFMELVWAYGLPEPKRQVPIADEQGFIGTVDFVWPEAWLVVEVDSRWHDGPLDKAADEERDRRLLAAGYAVRRYRYGELVARPGTVARELGAATKAILR